MFRLASYLDNDHGVLIVSVQGSNLAVSHSNSYYLLSLSQPCHAGKPMIYAQEKAPEVAESLAEVLMAIQCD